MSTVQIYHNPRCSKSRQTLALLQEHGYEVEIIDYIKQGLTQADIHTLLSMLNVGPRAIMRNNESEYSDYALASESLSETDLIEAIIKYPKLLQRPIVVNKNKAAIGRPPENVLRIL